MTIERSPGEVYAFVSDPKNLAAWASGLSAAVKVRFVERNPFGVLDHTVVPAHGEAMHNPMRVLANGDGSEVVFSLFRRPGMSDAEFARDADWVLRDLLALKAHLEYGAGGGTGGATERAGG